MLASKTLLRHLEALLCHKQKKGQVRAPGTQTCPALFILDELLSAASGSCPVQPGSKIRLLRRLELHATVDLLQRLL